VDHGYLWVIDMHDGLRSFFPEKALKHTFGESISHPLANLVVRSWGALITLIGVMLIYAAFDPQSREVTALIAGSSKLVWSVLFAGFGRQYLNKGGMIIGFDFVVAVVLFLYLFAKFNGA